MVGEAPLALLARLAALATGVESSFEHSPAMLEFRSRFVLLAGGASVWPRFWRALVPRSVPDQAPEGEHGLLFCFYFASDVGSRDGSCNPRVSATCAPSLTQKENNE